MEVACLIQPVRGRGGGGGVKKCPQPLNSKIQNGAWQLFRTDDVISTSYDVLILFSRHLEKQLSNFCISSINIVVLMLSVFARNVMARKAPYNFVGRVRKSISLLCFHRILHVHRNISSSKTGRLCDTNQPHAEVQRNHVP